MQHPSPTLEVTIFTKKMRNVLKLKMRWKIISHHIAFLSYGRRKVQKDAQENKISSKVAKFAGRLELIWQLFFA